MQPMDISSSISAPNGGRSSPGTGIGGMAHASHHRRADSNPDLLYEPALQGGHNSALSRRRICIALSLSVVLLVVLVGPNGLRSEAQLKRTASGGGTERADNPFRTTGRKKHGKNKDKKKKKRKNG
eukprot:CAMPEP_0181062918 /NCGR_PEP_ID=MMETSP1070-20121207/23340_1 /TAXON_ID=265543 /ORGANISM="Minutocellus polymorphus, Strain NH13" /LENGTH=125 /DNA_ID=CAMNT_0023143031 /DNA_START=45 /DNA_END=419 /DNA_ORIENTATION=+